MQNSEPEKNKKKKEKIGPLTVSDVHMNNSAKCINSSVQSDAFTAVSEENKHP